MKIAVVTDSGSGLTKQEANEQGIFFLPLQIIDEEKTYLDGVDIGIQEIFALIKEGNMMKTSLPPLGMVEELFQMLKKEGYEHILCVPITSGLSSTMHSLRLAAEEVGLPITLMETYTTCYIQGYVARSAKRLVDAGWELEAIQQELQNSIDHSGTLIIPDDLDHLKRGGRLTPLAAALGGMLKIKPVLKLDVTSQGRIDTSAKVRTMSKAMQNAVDTIAAQQEIHDDYILVAVSTDASEETMKQMQDIYFGKYPNCETVTGTIGAILAVHTGMGCIGLQYIKKVQVQ